MVALSSAASAKAAPLNDDFANRLPLSVGIGDLQSNSGATIEDDERLTANDPRGFGCEKDGTEGSAGVPVARTLWWKFTGPGGPVTVSTRNSEVDTVLAVYEFGTSGLVGCNDDLQPFDPTQPELHYNVDSEMFFETVVGREYAVQVGVCTPVPPETCGAADGNVALRVSVPPAHDDRANAKPISAGAVVSSSNTGATLEPGENDMCGLSPFAKTVWFRYTAPALGAATISASGFDTVLAVYEAGSVAPLACNDDAVKDESGASRLPSVVPAGDPLILAAGDYLIQVGGYHDPGFSNVAAANAPFQLQLTFEEESDLDGDGVDRGLDCDDHNPSVYPLAPEKPDNDIDEDCDGTKTFDFDKDGFLAPIPDCNDHNAEVHPGAKEVRGNRVDENCDGETAPRLFLKPRIEVGSFRYVEPHPHTWIRDVVVGGVPKSAEIELRCRGGCPFQSKGPIKVRQALGRLVVAHGFAVKPGATLEVRVTKPEWIGRAKMFLFLQEKPRRVRERCIGPKGALRPCARD